jgi:apolipoprotein N-acyltransferase
MINRFTEITSGWRGHIIAVPAGSLVTLSLAPFDIWPASIISAGLLALLLQGLTAKQAALRGWFFGAGLLGTGASWVYVSIHVYGYAPVPLALFLTTVYCGGIALLTALSCYFYQRFVQQHPLGNTLGFAATWVINEWVRTWLLTGFPWLFAGYAHLDSPLSGWAPVGGVLAISFLVVYSGAVIAFAIQQRKVFSAHSIAIIIIWLAGIALNQFSWVERSADQPLKVALVQANISQAIKWDRDQYWPTLNLYNSMSQPHWAEADIVVWPEAAIPGYYQNARHFLNRIGKTAAKNNATLITGVPRRDPQDSNKHYNSAMAFGLGDGIYRKQKLVPFGEYIPFKDLLQDLLKFFSLPMAAMAPGNSDQSGLTAGDLTLAPFICYEIVYPDLVASWLPEADLLITISNDAWFGASLGPLQHLQMAQMRALENGRYLIRSTGSGISAIINERGQITAQGGQFTQEVITGTVEVFKGQTPFSRTGSWPTLLLCFSIIGLTLIHNRPSR